MDGLSGVGIVALGAVATALATGLGPLPLLWGRGFTERMRAAAGGLAAGVMVAASVGLVGEGLSWSVGGTAVGALAGAAFVLATSRLIAERPVHRFAGVSGAAAGPIVLIILVMTAHSAAEGVGVGVAYGGGDALGVTTTVAIALHNIPEGLAIGLIMVPRGSSVRAACGWSIASSAPQPLLAVPAFLLVDWSVAALPVGLGFAAGAMVWMALFELIPDSLRESGPGRVWPAAIAAFVIVVALQLLFVA